MSLSLSLSSPNGNEGGSSKASLDILIAAKDRQKLINFLKVILTQGFLRFTYYVLLPSSHLRIVVGMYKKGDDEIMRSRTIENECPEKMFFRR